MANKTLLLLPVVLLAAACGGGAAKDAATAIVANADSLAKDSASKAPKTKAAVVVHHAFDTAAAAGDRPLERETYQYASMSVRDPFRPYVDQSERGPELPDLRLVALLFDSRNPERSIATFRDIGNDRRYTVSPGQRFGRISMVNASTNTVKLRMDDFGTAREQVYTMRKTEDKP
jgi:hypothetical protein